MKPLGMGASMWAKNIFPTVWLKGITTSRNLPAFIMIQRRDYMYRVDGREWCTMNLNTFSCITFFWTLYLPVSLCLDQEAVEIRVISSVFIWTVCFLTVIPVLCDISCPLSLSWWRAPQTQALASRLLGHNYVSGSLWTRTSQGKRHKCDNNR